MAWENPKQNWGQLGQTVPGVDDFNRIEGNIDILGKYDRAPGYGTATGTNAKTITLDPAPTSYYDGLCFAFKNATQNTGAVTINVNGLGAKAVKKPNGNDVAAGNLKAGSIYTVRYNGTNFILQGEGGDYGVGDYISFKNLGNGNVAFARIFGSYSDTYGIFLVEGDYVILGYFNNSNNDANVKKCNIYTGSLLKSNKFTYVSGYNYTENSGFLDSNNFYVFTSSHRLHIINRTTLSLVKQVGISDSRYAVMASPYIYTTYRDSTITPMQYRIRCYDMDGTLLWDKETQAAYGYGETRSVCYAGSHVYAIFGTDSKVLKLNPSTGALISTYTVSGDYIYFDETTGYFVTTISSTTRIYDSNFNLLRSMGQGRSYPEHGKIIAGDNIVDIATGQIFGKLPVYYQQSISGKIFEHSALGYGAFMQKRNTPAPFPVYIAYEKEKINN